MEWHPGASAPHPLATVDLRPSEQNKAVAARLGSVRCNSGESAGRIAFVPRMFSNCVIGKWRKTAIFLSMPCVDIAGVASSILATPTNRADMPDAEFERWVSPVSLAKVIGFLISEDAEPITGALIPVTGRV